VARTANVALTDIRAQHPDATLDAELGFRETG
jgi:hypothetical protein